jgi:hypothetical protein
MQGAGAAGIQAWSLNHRFKLYMLVRMLECSRSHVRLQQL